MNSKSWILFLDYSRVMFAVEMVGAVGEAVVFHREPAATTQVQRNRLASLREKMSIKFEIVMGEQRLCVITEKKTHLHRGHCLYYMK
jgi:hypothetical protein